MMNPPQVPPNPDKDFTYIQSLEDECLLSQFQMLCNMLLSMMVCACHPKAWEAEVGGSRVPGVLQLRTGSCL